MTSAVTVDNLPLMKDRVPSATSTGDDPVVVIKCGGSVLPREGSLPAVVDELYRHVRGGERVVAVVSAFGGVTDDLTELAGRQGLATPSRRAALLAIGERHAAATLALALDAAGVPATSLDERDLRLTTEGPQLEATPRSVDVGALRAALRRNAVVVIPGFVGRTADGETSLLGRGGSDLTAVFIAHALAADRCLLLKDVDGWFDRDPAVEPEGARRFESIPFEVACDRDDPIVQRRACRLARDLDQRFEIGGLGSARPTRVGDAGPVAMSRAASPAPPVRVALLGCGVVGSEVARRLLAASDRYELIAIAVRDGSRARPGVPAELVTDDVDGVLHDARCEVVIELTGAPDAWRWLESALERGLDVITANKAAFAARGERLKSLARETGRTILFGAAVGGAVPMVELVRRVAARDEITTLRGVLNGASGYILDGIGRGLTLDEAVRRARAEGLCEADPELDLSGVDAAHKAILLAREAGAMIDDAQWSVNGIDARGSTSTLVDDERRVRLVAEVRLSDGVASGGVSLEVLDRDDPLADGTAEARCALTVTTKSGWTKTISGRGAGGRPTTAAVLADLFDIARTRSRS